MRSPFWDSFDSGIRRNNTLSAIDKFNYLHVLLEGPATKSLQGLALSEANYEATIAILQERYSMGKHNRSFQLIWISCYGFSVAQVIVFPSFIQFTTKSV